MIVDHVSLYRTCTNVYVVYICTCICTWVCNQFVHFVQYITIRVHLNDIAVNNVKDVNDVNIVHRFPIVLLRSPFQYYMNGEL